MVQVIDIKQTILNKSICIQLGNLFITEIGYDRRLYELRSIYDEMQIVLIEKNNNEILPIFYTYIPQCTNIFMDSWVSG